MAQASRGYYRAHFWRVEAIDARRVALAASICALDNGAHSPHNRELWRGWKNASPDVQARFDRLNRIVARYRIKGWL